MLAHEVAHLLLRTPGDAPAPAPGPEALDVPQPKLAIGYRDFFSGVQPDDRAWTSLGTLGRLLGAARDRRTAAALKAGASAAAWALRRTGIRGLLRASGFVVPDFDARVAGRLTIDADRPASVGQR